MVCTECGGAIDVANSGLDSPARLWRGRPRRYCSDACRVRAYRKRRAADPDAPPPPPDPDRETARAARTAAADLAAAVTAIRAALPPERASRTRRSEGLREAAVEAQRAAVLAMALAASLAEAASTSASDSDSDSGTASASADSAEEDASDDETTPHLGPGAAASPTGYWREAPDRHPA